MFRKPVVSVLIVIATVAPARAQQLTVPLSLQRAVSTYIDKNLGLQSAKYRVERLKADQIAARLRPNPGLTITAENIKWSGPTPFGQLHEFGVSYAETIELGGKRELRERAATASLSAAEAEFADAMRRGIAEVKRLYLEALLARYNVQVATENSQTFQQLVQLNLARFEQGSIPEGDLIKVRLERIKFDSAVKQAELGLRQATIRLLERLGESDFSPQGVAGQLELSLIDPGLDSLRQTALQERADIQAAERALTAAKEQRTLQQAEARADLMPYAGFKRVGQDNTLMFGVSIPLKTRDRNQAGIARAEADLKIAETQLQLTRNRAIAEVTAAYEGFRTAREQVQVFRNEMLNQADQSRSIALAAYEEGATPLLPVLEAQRTRSEVQQQYFRTLFEYQAGVIDLELAIGKDLQP